MEKVSLDCEIVTPMFLGSANGQHAELRAPSFKGGLRFWWRALHGNWSIDKLHEKEAQIFGGSGDSEGRSKVIIRVRGDVKTGKFQPVPHKHYTSEAIAPSQQFTCILSSGKVDLLTKVNSLFQLYSILGGAGKRVHRGMGSFKINKIDGVSYNHNFDLQFILGLLNTVHPNGFKIVGGNTIQPQFTSVAKFPHIQQIQIGRPDANILNKISNATHDFKNDPKYRFNYEPSLGHAFKGRFASPIYVSTIKTQQGIKPVITTLYCAPNQDQKNISKELQENFKNSIL